MKNVIVRGIEYRNKQGWNSSEFTLNDEKFIPQNEEVVFECSRFYIYEFEVILDHGDTLYECHTDPTTRRGLTSVYTIESDSREEKIQSILENHYAEFGWDLYLQILESEEKSVQEDYDDIVNQWEKSYWEWKRSIS